MGDITALIPDDEADACILEEPEHLNWYRAPFTSKTWLEKFKHVVGIIHTNYLVYTRSFSGGHFKEPLLYYVNQGMGRAYCHKIIKLSGALQEFAAEKEVINNVNGRLPIQLNIKSTKIENCPLSCSLSQVLERNICKSVTKRQCKDSQREPIL